VIGDVDGDGYQEIVTTLNNTSGGYYDAKLLAIRSDGTIARSWQLTASHGFDQYAYPAPAIGDFDQDGKTEIAVAYELTGPNSIPGVVTILSTHAPYYSNNDWPTIFQNVRDTAVLLRTVPSTVTVTVADGSNPSILGDTVAFTATVTPGPATGAVQFFDGTMPLSGPLQLRNGAASFSTSALTLGAHFITARYTGDNKLGTSVSPAFVQQIVKSNSTVAITLSGGSNPSLAGDALSFTATVAPASATGTVIFFDNGTPISADLPLIEATATLTISSLTVGVHSITAHYSGDSTLKEAASTPWSQTINHPKPSAPVTVTLSAGSNPSVFGALLSFTAGVVPPSATGTVVFFDGPDPISGNIPLSGGTAIFSTSILGAGSHFISARYSGDAQFDASTSTALLQDVMKAPTQVELELAVGDDGLSFGRPLNFRATIFPSNATGTVMFFDGASSISEPLPVIGGSAGFTTSALGAGTHFIQARYGGDANFNSSSSVAHKVKVK
jgi:hypothetical protein